MGFIYHLCTTISGCLFRSSWGYKSVSNFRLRCSIWFPLCHFPTNWSAFYSCYNGDSMSCTPKTLSLLCDISVHSHGDCNSLHGLLRFYIYLILLIHFHVSHLAQNTFSFLPLDISHTHGILLKSCLTLLTVLLKFCILFISFLQYEIRWHGTGYCMSLWPLAPQA